MKRLIALLLAFCMVLSTAPMGVFAVPEEQLETVEAPAASQTEKPFDSEPEFSADVTEPVVSEQGDDILATEQTDDSTTPSVSLPGESLQFPDEQLDALRLPHDVNPPVSNVDIPIGANNASFDDGESPMSLDVGYENNIFYATANSFTARIGTVNINDDVYNKILNRSYNRVAAVDNSTGEIIAASKIGDYINNSINDVIYFDKKPIAGSEYSVRIIGGSIENPVSINIGVLKIVDLPLLASAYIDSSSFHGGATEFYTDLSLENLNCSPEQFSLSVKDEQGVVVAVSSDVVWINDGRITYKMVTTGEIIAGNKYHLTVSRLDGDFVNITSEVYQYAGSDVSGEVPTTGITIVKHEIDVSAGVIKLYTKGAQPNTQYNVSVLSQGFGLTLFSGILSVDENGIITIPCEVGGKNYGIALGDGIVIDLYLFNSSIRYSIMPDVVISQTSTYASGSMYKASGAAGDYILQFTGNNSAAKALYSTPANASLTLRKVTYGTETQIPTSSTIIANVTINQKENRSSYYYFTGMIKLSDDIAESDQATAYGLYLNNQFVGSVIVRNSVSPNSGINSGSYIYSRALSFSTTSNGSQLFWFELDKTLLGFRTYNGSGKATVEIADSDGNTVFTKEVNAVETSGQYHDYTVEIDKPASLVNGKLYDFTVTDGSDTLTLYNGMEYFGEKTYDDYTSSDIAGRFASMREGDDSISVELSAYQIGRNLTADDLQRFAPVVKRINSGEEIACTVTGVRIVSDSVMSQAKLVIDIKLSQPLTYGTYKVNYTYSYSVRSNTINIGERGKPEFSNCAASYEEKKFVYTVLCKNLPSGKYAGYVYSYDYSNSRRYYGQPIPITYSCNGESITFELPDDTFTKSVNCYAAIFDNGIYIGGAGCYFSPTFNSSSSYDTVDASVGIDNVYYTQQHHYAFSRQIALGIQSSAYTYVRFAEGTAPTSEYMALKEIKLNDFGDKIYYLTVPFELSNGDGFKNLMFQFKTASGEQTEVVPVSVLLLNGLSSKATINSVEVNNALLDENGKIRMNPNSPYSGVEFRIHATAPILSLRVEAVYGETKTGQITAGVSARSLCNEHENCWINTLYIRCDYLSAYDFTLSKLRFGVDVVDGEIEYYEFPIKVVGVSQPQPPPAEKSIKFLLDYYGTNYVNRETLIEGQLATPSSTVTVEFRESYGSSEEVLSVTTTASADGTFAVNLPEETIEYMYYDITAYDSAGRATDGAERVSTDFTAPVINTASAAIATDGDGAVITWSISDRNTSYIILIRNDEIIVSEEMRYDSNKGTYADVLPVDETVKYTLIAVDTAGNRSKSYTFAFEDNINPYPPTELKTGLITTSSIEIKFTAAKDNVGIEKYHIYRDGEECGTIDGEQVSYTDKNLGENQRHEYYIIAEDTSGNLSEKSKTISSKTGYLSVSPEYSYRKTIVMTDIEDEQLILRLERCGAVNVSNDYVKEYKAYFEYRMQGSEEWTSVELIGSSYELENWYFSNLKEVGIYELRVRVVDFYGDEAVAELESVEVIKDTQPPTVEIYSPSQGRTYGINQTITFDFRVRDDHKVLPKASVSVKCGDEYVEVGCFEYADGHKYNLDLSTIKKYLPKEDGRVDLRITGYDIAGNEGSADFYFMLDCTPPMSVPALNANGHAKDVCLTWQYPSDTSELAGYDAFKIYRSAEKDGEYTYLGSTMFLTSYMRTNYFCDTTLDEAGTYYYYVSTNDHYGNESTDNIIVSAYFVNDTESPKVTGLYPESGSVQTKSVTLSAKATDNFSLGKAVYEYKSESSDTWTKIGEVAVDSEIENPTDYTFTYTWDIAALDSGIYTVRVSVYDSSATDSHVYYAPTKANDPVTQSVTFRINRYHVPVAPVLSATPDTRSVKLKWTYSGDVEALEKFEIYSSNSESGPFDIVRAVNPESTTCTVNITEKTYFKLVAVDKYSERAESDVVAVTPAVSDRINPTAVISPGKVVAAIGSSVDFTAAFSTDNDEIVSYSWNFGDGVTANGVTVSHVFAKAGEFDVTLTVKDAAGNTGTAKIKATIVDVNDPLCGYLILNLSVVDGSKENTPAVSGATLTFTNDSDETDVLTAVSDKDGKINLLVKRTTYTVSAAAQGYSLVTKKFNLLLAQSGEVEQKFSIYSASPMMGTIKATEMTKEEMIAAGIDITNPDNYHYDKFAVVLEYTPVFGIKEFIELDIGYMNKITHKFTPSKGGWYGGNSNNRELEGKIGVFPISEKFLLIIYGEAHWLKEMYQVELLILNNTQEERLENVTAELELPEGLSFAKMNYVQQSAEQVIESVGPGITRRFVWYVCGDKEGSYYLSANVTADIIEGLASQRIADSYKTNSPIHVYAGNALKLTANVPYVVKSGEPAEITFRVTNTSNKPVYNFGMEITKIQQFKTFDVKGWHVENGELIVDKGILLDEMGTVVKVPVNDLQPGGYVEVTMQVDIDFNSILELAPVFLKYGTFLDPMYILTGCSKVSLAGSTTSIPMEVNFVAPDKPETIDLEGIVFGLANKVIPLDKILPFVPDGSIGDGLIWFIGENTNLPIVKEAQAFLKIQNGSTHYKFRLEVDDGKNTSTSIYNDYIEVTSSSLGDKIIDVLNGNSISVDWSGIKVKGKLPGDAKLRIVALPDDDTLTANEYAVEINFHIVDKDLQTEYVVTADDNEFKLIDDEGYREIRNSILTKQVGAIQMNPFQEFDSEVKIVDSQGEDSYIAFPAEYAKGLVDTTVTTKFTVSGKNADVTFDRSAFENLAGMSKTDVKFAVEKLLKDEIVSRFGAEYAESPTYEFTAFADDKEISDFGGIAKVSIPYTFANDENTNSIVVQHLSEDGSSFEQVEFVYDDEKISFETERFSCFRILKITDEIPTSKPEIKGELRLKSTLTAVVEGVEEGDLVYKWYRGDDFDNPIGEGSTYTLTEEDSNQKLTLRAYGTGTPYSKYFYISSDIYIPNLKNTYQIGDVDNNGIVDVFDIITLIDYIASGNSAVNIDVFVEPAAYINDDDIIDVFDVIKLLDIIANCS